MCRTHWFPSSDGKFAKEVFAFLQSDPACWNTVNIVTHVADVSADSLPSKTDVSPVCPASARRLQSGLLTSMGDLEYFRIPLSRTKKRCRGNKHKNDRRGINWIQILLDLLTLQILCKCKVYFLSLFNQLSNSSCKYFVDSFWRKRR